MHQGSHALQRSVSGSLSTSSYRTTAARLIARASSDGPRSASWGGGDAEPQLRGSFSASWAGSGPAGGWLAARLREISGWRRRRRISRPHWASDRGRYRVQEHRFLGSGSARVYEAADEESSEPCAVKTMDGDVVFADRRLMEELKREVEISLHLDHPNTSRFWTSSLRLATAAKVHLVQTGGDLHSS